MTLRSSSGVVAIPRTGEVLSSYERWHHQDALVCWASGTKVVTAGLVRALVGDGAFGWDTPVSEMLEVEAPATLTVESLVSHRSGLPRALPEQGPTVADPYAEWTTARFDQRVLPRLGVLASTGTPGEFGYSNVGYAVLARAVEASLGRAWLDLVRTRILAPLGLPHGSVTVAPPEGITRLPDGPRALSSRSLRGRAVPDWDTSRGPFAAAGGLCSTVPVMAQILRVSLDTDGPVAPGSGPHAWERQGSRAWHAGALMRSGSMLVVDTETRAVAAAHVVGGPPGHGATQAEKALSEVLATSTRTPPSGGTA